MTADPAMILARGAMELGLELSGTALLRFNTYLEELLTWNRRINLTGARTPQEVVRKHFLDSLAVVPWIRDLASLLDLGCGAGFPGVPLKLACPDIDLILVEATGKKVNFLRYLIPALHLTGVEIIQVHLTPRLSTDWGPRAAGVITRATLPLERVFTLAAPLILPGGMLLALKGPGLTEGEWQAWVKKAPALGLSLPEVHSYILPDTREARRLVTAHRLPG